MVTRFAASLRTDNCPQRKGSSTTVSRSDIRLIQHLDSSAHGLFRRWSLIGYFLTPPVHNRTSSFHDVEQVVVTDKNARVQTYTFDRVFPPSANTQRVYDGICAPIVQAAMVGYNGTIFAYGQTSSGKTHTLMGDAEEPGIIVLAVHDVFEHIAFAGASPDGGARFSEFLVRISYFEIYNEVIEDLFEDPGTKSPHGRMRLGSGASVSSGRQRVRITESSDGRGPIVVGAVEHEVTTPEQVLERLAQGELSRHYGATGMNQRSSRSHTIFRMALARYLPPREGQPPQNSPQPAVWKSTLNLVDLAGSERLAKTQATGQRAREGQAINLSLLTLGRVLKHLAKVAKMEEARRAGDAAIGAVGSGSAEHERELMRARAQAPFRDSQLTRLLQTSLGGNARTGESRGPPHTTAAAAD